MSKPWQLLIRTISVMTEHKLLVDLCEIAARAYGLRPGQPDSPNDPRGNGGDPRSIRDPIHNQSECEETVPRLMGPGALNVPIQAPTAALTAAGDVHEGHCIARRT